MHTLGPRRPMSKHFATEAGIMDSIDSKEGFLCNANAEQTLPHNKYAISLLIEKNYVRGDGAVQMHA